MPNEKDKENIKLPGMGWIKQKEDSRDLTHPKVQAFWDSFKAPTDLPTSFSLQSFAIPIHDQDGIGDCTAEALTYLAGLGYNKMGVKGFHKAPTKFPPSKLLEAHYAKPQAGAYRNFVGSRLYTYYFTRKLEGTVNTDSGAEIRDTIKTFASQGLPDEVLWPFNVSKFKMKPNTAAIKDASKRKAITYVLIDKPGQAPADNILSMKQQLVNGHSLNIGTALYDGIFNIGSDGKIKPRKGNQQPIGGHALHVTGYGPYGFEIQNSWGTGWGTQGWGILPYSYFQGGYQGKNFPDASDIWVVLTESWS